VKFISIRDIKLIENNKLFNTQKMKKIFQKLLFIAMIGLIVPSCGNPAKMANEADQVQAKAEPQILEVVANKINVKISATFPEKFFHPKGVVEVLPVLVYNGGEVAADAIMLQGENVTKNYITIPETGGLFSRDLTFDYVKGMEKSHLELRMTVLYKDKKIPFAVPFKVAEGANITYKIVKNHGALAYAPDAYQAKIAEQNETQILYLINSATVRPSQLRTEDVKAFEEFLATVKADQRRVVKNTEIVAYASPDGKCDFNEKLSTRRAGSASKAFDKKINRKAKIETKVMEKSISEDWDGFKELVANSNIEDKDLILRVLDMYSDPVVREREIKNMSSVYTTLTKDILPQLRRARFIANIEYTNFSDEELVASVNDNIEILDEEALLHAATLIKDLNKKMEVYKKGIEKFNSDRAKVNCAVASLINTKEESLVSANAEKVLSTVSNKDAYYYNTLGVIELRKGNNSQAAKLFAKSELAQSKENIAVIDILNGKYEEANSLLANVKNFNAALSFILVNKLDEACNIIKNKNCPCSSYLRAIIAARKGKVEESKAALKIAKTDAKWAEYNKTDIEFAKVK